MTFLAKLGAAILKGVQIVSGLVPIANTVFPGQSQAIQVISQDLAQIGSIITSVEAAGQTLSLPGPQKLQMAAPQVAQVILQSSMLVGHKIANPTLFNQGAQKIADGMADILNSLNPDGVQTDSKT